MKIVNYIKTHRKESLKFTGKLIVLIAETFVGNKSSKPTAPSK